MTERSEGPLSSSVEIGEVFRPFEGIILPPMREHPLPDKYTLEPPIASSRTFIFKGIMDVIRLAPRSDPIKPEDNDFVAGENRTKTVSSWQSYC